MVVGPMPLAALAAGLGLLRLEQAPDLALALDALAGVGLILLGAACAFDPAGLAPAVPADLRPGQVGKRGCVGWHRAMVVCHQVQMPRYAVAFEDHVTGPLREVGLSFDDPRGDAFGKRLRGGLIADAGVEAGLVRLRNRLPLDLDGGSAVGDRLRVARVRVGQHDRTRRRTGRAPAWIGKRAGRDAGRADSLAGDLVAVGVDVCSGHK